MRNIHRNITTTILLICLSLYCNSQTIVKKVTNFRNIKHNIDTLVILPSFVDIKSIGGDDKLYSDTVFSAKLSDTITYMIKDLLKKKYHLKRISGSKYINTITEKEFNKLFDNLDMSVDSIPHIEFPDSIFQTNDNRSRYCLFTVCNGVYISAEKRKKDIKEALPTTIAVGILSLGTVICIPANLANLTMRIILYDRVDKRVIYYKADMMPAFNKVDFYLINQFVLNNFKTIYCK